MGRKQQNKEIRGNRESIHNREIKRRERGKRKVDRGRKGRRERERLEGIVGEEEDKIKKKRRWKGGNERR